MKRIILITVIFKLIVFQQILFSQTVIGKFTFKTADQSKMTIPFKFISNLIIIPLQINNSDSLNFILDSGVRSAIISELTASDSIQLNYVQQVKLNGLGKGEPLDAYYSSGNIFRMKDIVGTNQNVYVLLENIFSLSSRLGMRVHGLIGYDLFKNFVVEINYTELTLTLYQPAKYKYKNRKNRVTFPIEIIEQKPYFQTEVTNNDGTTFLAKLLIDTGGSMGMWLAPLSNKKILMPEQTIDMFLGIGLNGDISGKLGRMKKFNIGKFQMTNLLVSFPDSQSVNNVIKLDKRNGSLGSEILRRFKVIIDYPGNKITFEPNSHLKDRFTYNVSGIEFTTPLPGLPIYEIYDIRKGSPAEIAGLRKGDQLNKINSLKVFNYSIDEIMLYFHGQKGKNLTISVMRDGQMIKTKLYLDDKLNVN